MALNLIEIMKVILLGIVEGVTEWLPISSTGHMLLVDAFIQLNMSEAFKEMFFVVIQQGAILAVLVTFWYKMMPLGFNEHREPVIDREILRLWLKVGVACAPGALATMFFDDAVEAYLHTPMVIAAALIFYGIVLIVIESWNKKRLSTIRDLSGITFQTAFIIGLFQVLSLIPGTSRSGATIIGALLIGVSRDAAAEFTFFLAAPVMFGLSALKILKFGMAFTRTEIVVMGIGMASAFIVSLLVIRFLMNYIKTHDFKLFGWYRIALGMFVLLSLSMKPVA